MDLEPGLDVLDRWSEDRYSQVSRPRREILAEPSPLHGVADLTFNPRSPQTRPQRLLVRLPERRGCLCDRGGLQWGPFVSADTILSFMSSLSRRSDKTLNSYVGPYQSYLDSLLGYPLYYPLVAAFQSSSGTTQALVDMVSNVKSDFKVCVLCCQPFSSRRLSVMFLPTYKQDPTVLGSFLENQDNPRFPSVGHLLASCMFSQCSSDSPLERSFSIPATRC